VLCYIQRVFGNKRGLAEQAVLGVFDDVVVVRSSGEAHHWKPTGSAGRERVLASMTLCSIIQLVHNMKLPKFQRYRYITFGDETDQ
jgi:hypothetical protein